MRQSILFLVGLVMLSSFISPCSDNNNFQFGDDITICLGDCYYRNSLGNIIECDAEVSCYLSAGYPNGTSIINFEPMDRAGALFSYNLSSYTLDEENSYPATAKCNTSEGFETPIDFEFAIIDGDTATIVNIDSGSGAYRPITAQVVEGVEKAKEKPRTYFLFWLLIIVVVFLVVSDIKHHRKKRKQIELKKEVEKIVKNIKGAFQ